jgi:hypothetical protein
MNVRIAQLLSFTAGTWYDGILEMNQYTVKLWMITQSENALEQNIAFSRMKHFVHAQLDSTIFIDLSDVKTEEFIQSGLDVTTMPGDPADQLIGIMLFHKLNAVMEGRILVVEAEISAGDAVVYLHGENETSESLEQPDWWHSADLVHSDISTDPDNVVSLHPVAAWRDVGLEWPTENPDPDNHAGNIVAFADIKNDTE